MKVMLLLVMGMAGYAFASAILQSVYVKIIPVESHATFGAVLTGIAIVLYFCILVVNCIKGRREAQDTEKL